MERDGAFSNKALDSSLLKLDLPRRDKAFASALVYGVLERKITLDYAVARFLTKSSKRLKPQVITILRMGAYQIYFMDKVPVSACVNECVKLAKNNKCEYSSGLINAVLRKAAQTEIEYPEGKDLPNFFSVRYSVEPHIAEGFIRDYGEVNAEKMLASSFGRPPVYIRVNTLRTSTEELKDMLLESGITAHNVNEVPNALMIENFDAIENNELYLKGLFHVQDIASQICVSVLDPKAGETLVDMCSAPGGKSFTAGQYIKNSGKIISRDVYESKIKMIESGAERLGIDIISAEIADGALTPEKTEFADRVLCDAPCSGFGTLRRKPEIRYRQPGEISGLPALQGEILRNAGKIVKRGGVLVYSTCTLNRSENEDVVERFICENPEFEKADILKNTDCFRRNKTVTLMPHLNNSDGFFICKMIKK